MHEIEVHEYHKVVADKLNQLVSENYKNIKGVIIGGPGPHKETFVNKDLLNHLVREKLIGVVDCSYTDEYGIREAIDKARDLLKESELVREINLIEKFKEEIVKDGLVCYGVEDTLEALQEGKVDTLLISEDFKLYKCKYSCSSCGRELEIFCSEDEDPPICCGKPMNLVDKKDVTDKLLDLAIEYGSKVEMISTETPEGAQFKTGFGGIGAFLRYK